MSATVVIEGRRRPLRLPSMPPMPSPRRKGRTTTPAPRRDAASCKEQSTWKAFVSLALVVCALERATTKGFRFARMDTHAGVIALNANHELAFSTWPSRDGANDFSTRPPALGAAIMTVWGQGMDCEEDEGDGI